MSNILLSVTVPTYNIEKYIKKNIEAFDSIKDELKDFFEVLIINDGSTDNTLEIVTSLIENTKNLNIRIINKKNGGHGSAVNKGIEEAKGKYFKIVDGDDWVDKIAFEDFLYRLAHTEVDMIVTNYSEQHIYKNKRIFKKVLEVTDNYESDILPGVLPMHSITYKTSILRDNNIKLTEGIFYVDTQYTVFPLKYISNWIYWDLDIYQYFLGRPDQSMSLKSRMKNIEHHRIVLESILEFHQQLEKGSLLEKITDDLSKSILNDRYLMAYLSDNKDQLLTGTTQYIDRYGIKYNFRMRRKYSWLIYINEKFGRCCSIIVDPLINKVVKKIK